MGASTVCHRSNNLIAVAWKYVLEFGCFLVIGAVCQTCTDHSSEFGFLLTDHIVRSLKVDRLGSCLIACSDDQTCQSFNFNLVNKICDFNNETKRSRPSNFVEKEIYVYSDNFARGELIFSLVFIKKKTIFGVGG